MSGDYNIQVRISNLPTSPALTSMFPGDSALLSTNSIFCFHKKLVPANPRRIGSTITPHISVCTDQYQNTANEAGKKTYNAFEIKLPSRDPSINIYSRVAKESPARDTTNHHRCTLLYEKCEQPQRPEKCDSRRGDLTPGEEA